MMNAILNLLKYNQLQSIVSVNRVVRRVNVNILPLDILLNIGIIILSLIIILILE